MSPTCFGTSVEFRGAMPVSEASCQRLAVIYKILQSSVVSLYISIKYKCTNFTGLYKLS